MKIQLREQEIPEVKEIVRLVDVKDPKKDTVIQKIYDIYRPHISSNLGNLGKPFVESLKKNLSVFKKIESSVDWNDRYFVDCRVPVINKGLERMTRHLPTAAKLEVVKQIANNTEFEDGTSLSENDLYQKIHDFLTENKSSDLFASDYVLDGYLEWQVEKQKKNRDFKESQYSSFAIPKDEVVIVNFSKISIPVLFDENGPIVDGGSDMNEEFRRDKRVALRAGFYIDFDINDENNKTDTLFLYV